MKARHHHRLEPFGKLLHPPHPTQPIWQYLLFLVVIYLYCICYSQSILLNLLCTTCFLCIYICVGTYSAASMLRQRSWNMYVFFFSNIGSKYIETQYLTTISMYDLGAIAFYMFVNYIITLRLRYMATTRCGEVFSALFLFRYICRLIPFTGRLCMNE